MRYNFNFKIQLIYGIVTFALTLGLIYLLINQLEWVVSAITGIVNAIIYGFFPKKQKLAYTP